MDTAADISQVTDAAREAARVLANATTQVKNRGLEAIAAALIERCDQILAANAEDVARGRAEQMSEGLLDRLALTKDRIRSIADAVREIVALPDPIGQVVRGARTDIGLRVTQERVPLGVVGIIYEARPTSRLTQRPWQSRPVMRSSCEAGAPPRPRTRFSSRCAATR